MTSDQEMPNNIRRLEQTRDRLQQEWDQRHKKIGRLRDALLNQSFETQKMHLEDEIKKEEKQQISLDKELSIIEQEIEQAKKALSIQRQKRLLRLIRRKISPSVLSKQSEPVPPRLLPRWYRRGVVVVRRWYRRDVVVVRRWYRESIILGFIVILLVGMWIWQNQQPPACRSRALDVSEMAFSPDGRYLATASLDKTVRVLLKATGYNKQVDCELHDDGVVALKFRPPDSAKNEKEETKIATASLDGNANLWNMNIDGTISFLKPLQHRSPVVALAFSPKGNYLATATSGGRVNVWDTDTIKNELEDELYGEYIRAISFSQDEKYLAVVGLNTKTVHVWDWRAKPAKELQPLPNNKIVAVAFSPKDSNYLATADADGNAQVWDTTTLTVVKQIKNENLKTYPTAISFSPNGEHLLFIGLDKKNLDLGKKLGKCELWEWKKPDTTILSKPNQENENVVAFAFTKNEKYIATASDKDTVTVWNSNGTRIVGDFPNNNNPLSKIFCYFKINHLCNQSNLVAVAFKPDDEKQLAVASANGMIRMRKWSVPKQ